MVDAGRPNEWPIRAPRGMIKKQGRTKARKEKLEARRNLANEEKKNKATVRRRDKFCRFPLCGCRKLGLSLEARGEVSHDKHKGMGGNPSGDRSIPALMILLCKHRHQDGIVSRHKGTLRLRHLTARGNDGPIAWDIDKDALYHSLRGERRCGVPNWVEVARETKVQTWAPFTANQLEMLEMLAEMDL